MNKSKIIKCLAYTLIITTVIIAILSRVITFNQIGLNGADATQHFYEMHSYYQSKTLPVMGSRFEMGSLVDDSKPKVPGGFFYLHYLICYTLGGGDIEVARVWNLVSMLIPLLVFLFWVFRRFGIVPFAILSTFTIMNAYYFVTNMSFYNPNLILTLSFLVLPVFGEYVLQKKPTLPAILIFPILAYMGQAHFNAFYTIIPTVIVYMIIRHKKTIKNIKPLILSVFLAFVSYIPYLVYEINNNFINIRKMMSFGVNSDRKFFNFPQVHSLFMFPTDEFSVLYTGNTFKKLMAFWLEDNKYVFLGLPVMVISIVIMFSILIFILIKYFKNKMFKFENIYTNEKDDNMIILNEMMLLYLLYFPTSILITFFGAGISGHYRYHYGAFALSFTPLLYFTYYASKNNKNNILIALLIFSIINTISMHTSIISYFKKYELPYLWKVKRDTVLQITEDASGKDFNIIADNEEHISHLGLGYSKSGQWLTNKNSSITYYVQQTPLYTNIDGKLIVSNQFYIVKRIDSN